MASAVACRCLALVLAIVVIAVSVSGAAGSSKLLCITNNCSGKQSTSSPSSQQLETANQPPINGSTTTTPYTGDGSQVVGQPWRIVLAVAVLGLVTAALGVLANFLGLFKLCCS